MRHLYLAATGQNRGKTTAALGLLDGFRRRGFHTGFMKPVGQRPIPVGAEPADDDGLTYTHLVDEDALLMRTVFGLPESGSVMSPVHIPRGFTKAYIAGEVVEDLGALIVEAHRHFAGHEILLIEGTGHAGVGAVVGLSNAMVASMLGAPAVIVSEGGVGRPIDEIVLNASYFAAHGVPVAGALVNKVRIDEQPGIERTLERGLALHGIPLLGVLPYRPILSSPTLGMVLEGVHGRVINTGPDLDRVIGGVAVGAMEPHHMLDRMGPCTLVIVASDRSEAILELAAAYVASRSCVDVDDQPTAGPGATAGAIDARNGKVLGLVLTGGYEPGAEVLAVLRNAGMFAASVDEDTYTVASQVQGLLVKTHAADTGKIELIKELVWEHLKMDRFLEVASEPRFA